jgi:hypothetical protein
MNKMCDFRALKKQFLIAKNLHILIERAALRGANRATGRDGARLEAQIAAPPTGPQTAIQAVDDAHLNVAPCGMCRLWP